MENHKATKPEFNVGPPSADRETPFQGVSLWATDGPLQVVIGSHIIKENNYNGNKHSVGHPLTKLSGSAHVPDWRVT